MSNRESRYNQIGLDRLVHLEWLEKTASLVLAGNTEKDIKETLQYDISGSFRSNNLDVRGSINKTITILLKVWLRLPRRIKPLNEAGLNLLKQLPQKDHIMVHWGMTMAVYPFWANVAIQTGRLLRLQSNVVAFQIQRRIREQYGERETVARRARYVLRSYLEWKTLFETDKKGVYKAPSPLIINDQELMLWLAEAFLHSRQNGSSPAKELYENPAFFPFRFETGNVESLLMKSDNLEVIRHGLDDIYVRLKN